LRNQDRKRSRHCKPKALEPLRKRLSILAFRALFICRRSARGGAVRHSPSVIFGPEDDFFNRFAALAKLLPVLPLIGGGHTRFQPVFVDDIAQAIANALADDSLKGIYELGGPRILTFKEILEYVLTVTDRRRPLLPLPFGIAKVQANIMEIVDKLTLGLMPRALTLTHDQVLLLQRDNVVSGSAIAQERTLEALIGAASTPLEAVVPSYLVRFRRAGQFTPNPQAA
jgi:hypothetical protein